MNCTFFMRNCSLTVCSDHFTGEFGSVREALLKLDDGSFQKVAVKMLKGKWEICPVFQQTFPDAFHSSLSFPLSHSTHVVSHPSHDSLFVVQALQ